MHTLFFNLIFDQMGKSKNMETLDTEQKILVAAKEVFIKKSYAGARMQEIADLAGMNKGLLHYYFRSKEKLFQRVFDEMLGQFVPKLNIIFESDLPLFEKIECFVNDYIDVLIANPYLPSFVLHELNQNPDAFVDKVLNSKNKPNPIKLMMQIQLEVQLGKIRPTEPMQLVLNMMSMCVFPFLGKPIFQRILNISHEDYLTLMELRKKEISTFIIASLKAK